MTINQLSCHFLFEGRDWAVLTLSKLHASKTGSIITMPKQAVCVRAINLLKQSFLFSSKLIKLQRALITNLLVH